MACWNPRLTQGASMRTGNVAPRRGLARPALTILASCGLLAACSQSQPAGDAAKTSATPSGGVVAGNPANQKLDDAASAAENLVEAVLANDKAAGDKAFADLQKAMGSLTAARLGKDAVIVGELDQAVNAGWRADDRPAAAMAAVSLYAKLQQAKDWTGAEVPLAVSMLDHAGFKSELLAAQGNVDWAELAKTADEARGNLTALEPLLQDGNLKQVAAGIVGHLSAGVKSQDLARVQSAARDLLAVVDLLEQQFQRQASKQPPK